MISEKTILQCDLVELSTFIHNVGVERFRREKDIQKLFDVMFSLDEVGLSLVISELFILLCMYLRVDLSK